MSQGLSFKTVKASSLSKLNEKLAGARQKGWYLFGETTKELKGDAGYYQVLAKHKMPKKHE